MDQQRSAEETTFVRLFELWLGWKIRHDCLDAVVVVVRINAFTIQGVLRYMCEEELERGKDLPSPRFSRLQISGGA